MGLNECGLKELVDRLGRGEVSPLDIARDVVGAFKTRESKIQAYLDFYEEDLLAEAKQLTESGAYRSTALRGVPVMLKDNIALEGKRTTCGSRILEKYVSPYSSTAALRLRSHGAIIGGKTNLDEFAMGSSTENSAFGVTRNPWDLDRVPGGSSGGSAAAVASDMAIAALGSDTGGSIRQPASFCGVVGMKPTYGRVSRYGLVAFASSLDQIGVFAKCVEDCALILNVICGKDPKDATSLSAVIPDFTADLERGLQGLKIGIPWDFVKDGMDDRVDLNFRSLIEKLGREGASFVEISMPNAKYAVACYYVIANAEASSNLARYDGVKYGHRADGVDDILALYTKTRAEGFGAEVKRRILLGTYVLSAGYYDAYYLKAQKVRSLIVGDFKTAFERCDLVMIPTSPTPAFKIGEKIGDPLQMYLADIFTIPVNLAGLPGISFPSGLTPNRLPLGVQFIGRPLDESTVVRGAYGAERTIGFEREVHV